MFRLVRVTLSRGGAPDGAARIAAWVAAMIYGANPNLIYMQTTAMGEAIYLAFFVWAVVYFSEFARGEGKSLVKCGACLAAASLTRYDGWFLAAVMVGAAVLSVSWSRRDAPGHGDGPSSTHSLTLLKFVLLVAVAPALWLAYNAAVYRNPLEFANGPYSAQAIAKKTGTTNPADENVYAAGMYFLKSAELNVAEPTWLGRSWLALAMSGTLIVLVWYRGACPLVLFWTPLPFYIFSLAYGHVPIFVPVWWPFSHYNVRYGLELLPAFAAFVAVLVYGVLSSTRISATFRRGIALAVLGLVIAGYGSVWRAEPICYREASINMRGRLALEHQLAGWLEHLPPNATLLMYLGDHPGAVQQAGIPLKRVINEGNHRVWKQPADPEGLWERALANPSEFADYVVAFEGDSVWQSVQGRHLRELVEINVTGQGRAILYRAR
jgi:hypothetical protein